MFTWYKRLRVVFVALTASIFFINWLVEQGVIDGFNPSTVVTCIAVIGVCLALSTLGWLGADALARSGLMAFYFVGMLAKSGFRALKRQVGYDVPPYRPPAGDSWRR